MSAWTLHRGDSLAVLRDLPTASVDALITDGPYSSGGMTRGDRQGSTRSKYTRGDSGNQSLAEFAGDNRDQRSFAYWCALWLSECMRACKPGAPALLFSDWRQVPATTDSLQAGGFVWRGLVPWLKPNARPQRGRFAAGAEFVVWGSAGPMADDGPCLRGFFEFGPPRDREHTTQKPVELMRELVKICPPGGTVLDPFAGSGTTGVAALLEGRGFVGVELSAHYHEVATRRLTEAAGGFVERDEQTVMFGGGL